MAYTCEDQIMREKTKLIANVSSYLSEAYKPADFGRIILPFVLLKRFDDALQPSRDKALYEIRELNILETYGPDLEGRLRFLTNKEFYNTSEYCFDALSKLDSDTIGGAFETFLGGFSNNVKEIIQYFQFETEIKKLATKQILLPVIQEFCTPQGDFSPENVSTPDMGTFYELFPDYIDSQGTHFSGRDVILLMSELLLSPNNCQKLLKKEGKSVYDMTMGTGQMLSCFSERFHQIYRTCLTCYGQEFNPEVFALAKAEALINFDSANILEATNFNYEQGNTLLDDRFKDEQFGYVISNPPFGIAWKREKNAVEAEALIGENGRFGAGLPPISDGQMLFLLNGVNKMAHFGRMAIIQTGSSLFTGGAGSGPSNIRKYIIENDWLEAVIKLPSGLFHNTAISTYIWLLSKAKISKRRGKVQLIDASKCYKRRERYIKNRRVELDDACIELIKAAYEAFEENEFTEGSKCVKSKVFNNDFFSYEKNNRIGYEIPFTKLFFEFKQPDSPEDILKQIKKLETQEKQLLEILFGDTDDE